MLLKLYKTIIRIASIATSAFFYTSCQKDKEIPESHESKNITIPEYTLSSELKVSLQQSEGLVIFKNQEQFDNITNLLLDETEAYIASFFEQFDTNASVDEVNKIVDELEFNPNVVYEAFESYHSISSLRSKLVTLEDKWLNNEELIGDNPANYPLSERCLPVANKDGEYQIGTTIYRVENSGVAYEIANQDYAALNLIRTSAKLTTRPHNNNVTVHRIDALEKDLKSTMANCISYIRKTGTAASGSHRMDMIIDLDWDGYGSAAKAKTEAYRKKTVLGKTYWGREWTAMYAMVHIVDYDADCNEGDILSKPNSSNWAYYVVAHVYQGDYKIFCVNTE